MSIVLVVEDEASILDALVLTLEEIGHQPIATAAGRSAIALAIEHRPDVIVLDIKLPDMDGFVVCRTLKANPATRDIPILFLTGFSSIPSKLEGFACGAIDYMTKPFEMVELAARLRVLLTERGRQVALMAENALLREKVMALEAQDQADEPTDRCLIPTTTTQQHLLSFREQQIYKLVGRGCIDKQIATHLRLGAGSVKTYVARIKVKLNLTTRRDMVAHYKQLGEITAGGTQMTSTRRSG